METKINLYKKIERSGNDVEIVRGKSWICHHRSGICKCGIDVASEFEIKSYMTLGQNKSSPHAHLTN